MRYHILSNNSSSVLNITQIGFSADTKITRFGPGKRNLYIIHYVTKGKGYYNGNLITAGQGLYLLKNSVCKNKKTRTLQMSLFSILLNIICCLYCFLCWRRCRLIFYIVKSVECITFADKPLYCRS